MGGRVGAALVVALCWLLVGCEGGGVSRETGKDDRPVAHPRDVAAKVNVQVAEVERGLAVGRPLARRADEVRPTPCGADGERKSVKGADDPNANPGHASWFVTYSPYSIGASSWVDLPQGTDARAALTRLHDHLQKSGWRIESFKRPSGGLWELAAESPERGYGGRIEGPLDGGKGQVRIGVGFSSPCFRHPDELRS